VIEYLFGTAGFMPHGYCLLWRPDIVGMHVGADMLIFVAYSVIAFCLHLFVKRRPEFRYSTMVFLSAAFIGGCGITHLFAAVSLWWPAYGMQALLKLGVALISVAAAVQLWRSLPSLASYPSLSEIEARKVAENALKKSNEKLGNALSAAKSADTSKAAFLAAMSHDLRTPLNAILGFGEALAMGISGKLANAKQSEYVDHIRGSAAHLLTLINDLLDLSGVEADQTSWNCKPITLSPLLQEIATRFEVSTAFAQRELSVKVECPETSICADEPALRRIFNNLLENSAKYAPRSTVIEIVAEQSKDYVAISVIDDGPGFPEGREESMRAPFSREKASDDGLGIGLAIVDALTRKHGGKLELSNEANRGAKVTVRLPVVCAVPKQVPKPSQPPSRAPALAQATA